MLDDKDIEKIIKAMEGTFPTKEGLIPSMEKVFATKKDLSDFTDEMREMFSDLQTSVDAYAKKADTYFQEMLMLSNKVNRMEKWMHEIAEKVGIELKY
jgi:hypothetical protein